MRSVDSIRIRTPLQRRIALLGALVCALAAAGVAPSAASAQLVISENAPLAGAG